MVSHSGGLSCSVHKKLQSYVNHWFSSEERASNLVFDRVEVKEFDQTRAIILKNFDSFYCVSSTIDFTKHVHGKEDDESEVRTFHLPAAAVRSLMHAYISDLESDRAKLQAFVSRENDNALHLE